MIRIIWDLAHFVSLIQLVRKMLVEIIVGHRPGMARGLMQLGHVLLDGLDEILLLDALDACPMRAKLSVLIDEANGLHLIFLDTRLEQAIDVFLRARLWRLDLLSGLQGLGVEAKIA
mgnify:CR=1 FL=1